MTFFQSDVVRAEMAEISELQEEVYNNVFKFPSMSSADINNVFNDMSKAVSLMKDQIDNI